MKLTVTQVHRLILVVLLLFAVVGCEKVGDVASGAGSATKNLANKIFGEKSPETDEQATEEQANRQTSSGIIGESESDSAEESDRFRAEISALKQQVATLQQEFEEANERLCRDLDDIKQQLFG